MEEGMKVQRVHAIYAVLIAITVIAFVGCFVTAARAEEAKYLVAIKAPTGETVVMECHLPPPSPQVQAR
jgi:hypothetical protein